MKLIVPNYYDKFKCIADQCKHNCCIGWEIDIDEDTYALYRSIPGNLGQRLSQYISAEGSPHFILGKEERCPFLNDCNLCDIITELGEDALCDICADHPRFRNYLSDRVEMGIGLCCEAAGALILTCREKVTLITLEDDEKKESADECFLALREKIFAVLQNRAISIYDRISEMLALCKSEVPAKKWIAIYKELERLDPKWDKYLDKADLTARLSEEWALPLEQLAVYFTYRHLSGALEDGLLTERAAFIALSVQIITAIAATEEIQTIEGLAEIARLYSAEIEYSDENIEILLNKLTAK